MTDPLASGAEIRQLSVANRESATLAPAAPTPDPYRLTLVPAELEATSSAALRVLVLTDLVGYTKLTETLGDAHAADLQSHHDRLARDLLARHHGLEIDKSDGFLLLFERPADAVGFALAYHQALDRFGRLGQQEELELAARVGIHVGEVFLRRNPDSDVARGAKPLEVEGLAKPLAARVMSLAVGRQTLLTRGAFDLARRAAADGEGLQDPELRWLAHGEYALQGVDDPVEIFEIGLQHFAPLAEPPDTDKARRAVAPSEELTLGWRPATGQPIPRRANWTLIERLGEGGFGEVWLAEHKSGERRVFKFCFEAARLKALKREVTLFRLMKEALGHRNDIARILDWHFDDAPYFLEAEYTEGGNLVVWAEEQGGLAEVPLSARLELVAEVAGALAAAHSVGILHKNVKPENVLITTDRQGHPRARLADFGIGLLTQQERLTNPDFTVLGFTQTIPTDSSSGGILGYLAPELIEGKTPTVQADLYSLGVLLYQLVVGDFSRALAPGWKRDIEDEILMEDIAHFVDGHPENRPASAREVAERLRTLDERRAARAEEEARRLAFERSQRRRRLAMMVVSVAVVVMAVVTMMAVHEYRAWQEADQHRGQAETFLGFLLGDLQDEFDTIGRLDLLETIEEQAIDYFVDVPVDQLSSEELLRRNEALNQLSVRGPGNSDIQRELVNARNHLGFIERANGDLVAVEESFRFTLSVFEALLLKDPQDPNLLRAVSDQSMLLGQVLWQTGKLADARLAYERGLRLAEQLGENDPQDTVHQEYLASVHNVLGQAFLSAGDLESARHHLQASLEILEGLVAIDPEQATRQRELAFSRPVGAAALDARIAADSQDFLDLTKLTISGDTGPDTDPRSP